MRFIVSNLDLRAFNDHICNSPPGRSSARFAFSVRSTGGYAQVPNGFRRPDCAWPEPTARCRRRLESRRDRQKDLRAEVRLLPRSAWRGSQRKVLEAADWRQIGAAAC